MIQKLRLLISIVILSFTLNAAAQSQYIEQIGLIDSLKSEILNESREFYVQIPDSYIPGSDQRYPVVYILDGEIQLSTLFVVQDNYSGGFLPEMILVGVSNAKNRLRDLTTSKVQGEGASNFNQEHGESENFLRFMETELIPYVEKNYPVTSYRTLIGHSYGGHFAIHTLINHPEVFDNYLAIDPSMDWNEQSLLKQAEQELSGVDLSRKSLFMSLSKQLHMSDKDITIDNVMQDQSDMTLFARSNIAFSQLADKEKAQGFRFYWKFYPNELHGTIPLPSMMDGLLTIFEWYQMENIERFNEPDATVEELTAIAKHREDKLFKNFGYKEPPYPNFLLNMKGYMSMDMAQYDLAKMYFTLCIEYYPNDANAYDSMADYYERQEEYEKALENVTKAYEISGSDAHKKRMEDLQAK